MFYVVRLTLFHEPLKVVDQIQIKSGEAHNEERRLHQPKVLRSGVYQFSIIIC